LHVRRESVPTCRIVSDPCHSFVERVLHASLICRNDPQITVEVAGVERANSTTSRSTEP